MKKPNSGIQAIGMVEMGAVSRLTRGIVYYLPWFELGPPPFVYACPYC